MLCKKSVLEPFHRSRNKYLLVIHKLGFKLAVFNISPPPIKLMEME